MTYTDHELANKITSLLDHGATRLEPGTAERLAAAREQALSHYQAQPSTAWSWATASGNGRPYGGTEPRRPSARMLLLLAAVVVSALAAGVSWHSSTGPDIADIDAGLLTDELPINAFLDQGLDSWVKRVSR